MGRVWVGEGEGISRGRVRVWDGWGRGLVGDGPTWPLISGICLKSFKKYMQILIHLLHLHTNTNLNICVNLPIV